MSIFGLFHPETLMTGAARSAELQAAVSVCDSPGQSVISLSFQIEDCSSLPPASSVPAAVPLGTSARGKKPTAGGAELLVIVTVAARSAPSGPARWVVVAVAVTLAYSVFSACRFTYCDSVPCGCPRVCGQFVTSCWVDSQ